MRARGLGGLSEVAGQGGVQHVLHQRALATAGHAGHGHQALQGELDADVAQVVFACTFQNQARRGFVHQAREAAANVLARAQIGTCQGISRLGVFWGAVEHDLAAALPRAGAHVDQAVGGQHHGRVVLHHHQGVARVPQAVHRLHDAVHVARVQPDAGLVQHEQGVDQGRAQCGGEVNTLHLAAAEGAALPVQRQVTQAHLAQVLQAVADFIEQQLERIVEHAGRQGQAVEEAAQPRQGKAHQVVQAQAVEGFQLLVGPLHARGHEAAVALSITQDGIGVGLAADAPQQRFGLQPRAVAHGARGVAAVLRQQHPDVHLVGLALQVLEEAAHAVPLLVPLALPVGVAFDHPMAVRLGQLGPRGVARDAVGTGVAHQVVLALRPSGRLQRLDGAVAQGLAPVGNHQAPVDPNHPAEAAAGFASAPCGVEAEQGRLRVGVTDVAFGAVQAGGVAPHRGRGFCAGQGGRLG